MAAKSEALAKQFEDKARDAKAVIGALTDADWKKTTEAEHWTVGVTAHHLAGSLEAVAGIVKGIVSGQTPGNFTMRMLDEMNAAHAKDHANCTKAETVAMLERGTATALSTVRGLSDEQLATSAKVFSDAPAMTAEQLVNLGLINHVAEHLASIKKAVGR